jgi:hypothetical protein
MSWPDYLVVSKHHCLSACVPVRVAPPLSCPQPHFHALRLSRRLMEDCAVTCAALRHIPVHCSYIQTRSNTFFASAKAVFNSVGHRCKVFLNRRSRVRVTPGALRNLIIFSKLGQVAIFAPLRKINQGVPRACLGVSVRGRSPPASLDFQAPSFDAVEIVWGRGPRGGNLKPIVAGARERITKGKPDEETVRRGEILW